MINKQRGQALVYQWCGQKGAGGARCAKLRNTGKKRAEGACSSYYWEKGGGVKKGRNQFQVKKVRRGEKGGDGAEIVSQRQSRCLRKGMGNESFGEKPTVERVGLDGKK